MGRLIATAAVATAFEWLAVLGVVHLVLRLPLQARGLQSWRLADTLLTSPVLFAGAAIVLVAVNRVLLLGGWKLGRGEALPAATVWWTLGAAALGAAMCWFGVRTVGKLF